VPFEQASGSVLLDWDRHEIDVTDATTLSILQRLIITIAAAYSRRSYDTDVADFECALAEVIEARFVAQAEEQR
jgi:hypothetical protein